MSVYQGLQLDPAILKQYIRNSSSAKEKRYYYGIMAARSLLIVAFAMVFIGGLSQIFGQENSPHGGGAAHCGHVAGSSAGHGVCMGVPPSGDSAGAAQTRGQNDIKKAVQLLLHRLFGCCMGYSAEII